MFARAGNEDNKPTEYENRKRPLELGRVIAEPKQNKRDNNCRGARSKGEPGDPAFVGKPVATLPRPIHDNQNSKFGKCQSGSDRNSKLSETILLQTPVKCASAQAQCFRCLARVAVVSRERFLYQERFDFLKTHLFEAAGFTTAIR